MYVCCWDGLHMLGRYVFVALVRIHGESYAHALLVRSCGSGLRSVVAGVDYEVWLQEWTHMILIGFY